MIFYIDKPGFYRTFSDVPPVFVLLVDKQRETCGPLIFRLVQAGQKDLICRLLADHGAQNLQALHDDAVPVFLAQLQAVVMALGLSDE